MKTRKICIDAQTGIFSNVNRDCVVFYWSSNSRYWYQSIKRMTFICFISFLSLSTFAHIDVELFHVNDAIDVSSNAILQDYNLPDGFSFISGSFFLSIVMTFIEETSFTSIPALTPMRNIQIL